jgi:hypothetical protein
MDISMVIKCYFNDCILIRFLYVMNGMPVRRVGYIAGTTDIRNAQKFNKYFSSGQSL